MTRPLVTTETHPSLRRALDQAIIDDSVFALIERRGQATPDQVMALDDRGRSITFGEYLDLVLDSAARLAGMGIAPGRPVAWQMPTAIDTLVLAGALSRLGVCQVLLMPAYGHRELSLILGETQAQAMIVGGTSTAADPVLERLADEFAGLAIIDFDRIADAPRVALPAVTTPGADEARWILYTSGTTGKPKGVVHTDQTVTWSSRATFAPVEMTANDRMTLNYPVAHIGGILTLCTLLATGGSAVVVERFDPQSHVPIFSEAGVTIAGAGPPFFRMYLATQAKHPQVRFLPDVRVFQGAGSPRPPGMHEALKSTFGGFGVTSAYGMSECPLLAHMLLESPADKVTGTDGLMAMDMIVRAVDDQGRDVPAGETGEIIVKGPYLFRGYVDAELNETAFDADGFFRTGDLGFVDADGYVKLTGRLKDLIIRKGENISPMEIEGLLTRHERIAEAAVVGVPDDERGEMAVAFVVLREGASGLTFEEMSQHLHESGLARYKRPERLEIVDALPKNAMNKVVKAELARWAQVSRANDF